ncbi:3-oxoacyl-[acyl-carrier-protein] reductase FabG [Anaerohalosphaera lusitana]|uniref:3-oxoacyl-[acyl-carrier-protein] reductase FabG n=1 Tax=Anaerohalosphaera lusitana TaxID=1936003 RepID=A0A1U9NPU8_9BACT|nr:SDR family oxidoreductase [Anaerohalosphaera lusitana]AQT69754.1 3-oxoacyl-[acyl-carrier-protein] reductase FabG [Anaerohalosphaera lusitana]
MNVENTTAIITGATGTIGGAIALELARMGCDCVLHYNTRRELAEELAETVRGMGVSAVCVQADLTEAEQIRKLFIRATDAGPARVLVNSAAVFVRQPLRDVTAEGTRRVLDMNLTAAIIASQEFVRSVDTHFTRHVDMEAHPLPIAKIVNLVDVGGERPWANYTTYCASKAGLIAATKSMAKELAPAISVNAIAPGMVNFPRSFSEEERERQLKMIPAGRIGKPSEVAGAVKFLLENDYVTGQVINVDGGRCI